MARDRVHDPRALDLRAFCRDRAELQGDLPLAALERLAESLYEPPGDARVNWQAQGEERLVAGGEPERRLHLRAQGAVVLQCQRCLQSVSHVLTVDTRLRFVPGEEEAERLDETSEEDVLALLPRLDLQPLLEDELLLALPLVPRHEGECPQPLPLAGDAGEVADAVDATDGDGRPNPFAALAALRKPGK
jgi:uncharacterized protein